MIRDLLSDPVDGFEADVCVVGAGAAGILLTVELLRLGKTVTLLEAGGRVIEEASQDPYASEVVGRHHEGVTSGRFRVLGGTTLKWGGQILELNDEDFEARPWVAGSGWPIAKAELAPYYEQALLLEGLGTSLREDAAVWKSIGRTMPEFAAVEQYFSRWCPEPNFARYHRETLNGHPGLAVYLHANAVEMMLKEGKCNGVRCRTLTGVEAVFRATDYVFCLGAIESSRFFLQPREGSLPWNESGLLGRHFQDHLDVNCATIEPRDETAFHDLFDNVFSGGYKYHPKLMLKPKVQAQQGTLNVAGTIVFESDVNETLARFKGAAKHVLRGRFGELSGGDLGPVVTHLPLFARQVYRYAVEHRAFNPPGKILLRAHAEQEPLSESSITLAEARDALRLLRTRIDWRIAERELRTIRMYVEAVKTSLDGVAHVVVDEDVLAGSFAARCDDTRHHMGGMKMAAAVGDGVVDTDLKLFGTKNVFVCSSAVFPCSGHSNPTHTLLALAMRLAAHLSYAGVTTLTPQTESQQHADDLART